MVKRRLVGVAKRQPRLRTQIKAVLFPPVLALDDDIANLAFMNVCKQFPPQRVCLLMSVQPTVHGCNAEQISCSLPLKDAGVLCLDSLNLLRDAFNIFARGQIPSFFLKVAL